MVLLACDGTRLFVVLVLVKREDMRKFSFFFTQHKTEYGFSIFTRARRNDKILAARCSRMTFFSRGT